MGGRNASRRRPPLPPLHPTSSSPEGVAGCPRGPRKVAAGRFCYGLVASVRILSGYQEVAAAHVGRDPSPARLGWPGPRRHPGGRVRHIRGMRVLVGCPRSKGACGRRWVAGAETVLSVAPRAGRDAARGGLESGAREVGGIRVPAIGGTDRLVLGQHMCRGGVQSWCVGRPVQSAIMAVAGPPLVSDNIG